MIPYFSPQRSARTEIFDLLPPIAAEAAYAIHAKTGGVDEGLIRAQMMAVISAAIAPLYRIKLPNWHPIPLDIPVICVGRSGSGKSPVFIELQQPFKAFADKRDAEFGIEIKEYEASKALRVLRLKELQKAIEKMELGEDRQEAERERNSLLTPLPRPKLRSRSVSGLEFEKLVHLLDGDNEAVDFLLSEGDQAIGSLLFRRHAGDFNDLHDGTARLETPQNRRKGALAKNSNVARLILVRESALSRYLPVEKSGKIEKSTLVDLGFFARGLIYFADQLPRVSGLWAPNDPDASIGGFNEKIYQMLESHHAKLLAGDTSRTELQLAPDAVDFWVRIGDEIRAQRSAFLNSIDEHLGKLQSLTARLASVFHVVESESHFVTLSALQRAWHVVTSLTPHYQRAFAPPPPPPPPKQAERDIYALANLFRERGQRMQECDYNIKVEECVVRLNISKRRVLHAASKLEDHGQASISPNREEINFRNLTRPTSYITSRF